LKPAPGQEALMSQFYATSAAESNHPAPTCDCLAHVYGNADDQPDRMPCYPTDMSDAEWAVLRAAMPVMPWLEGRGGRPDGYCHRQMIDAVRYLVDGGVKWRALPKDFPPWDRVYAFAKRWRVKGLLAELHDRLRAMVREHMGRDRQPTAGIIDAQSLRAASNIPKSTTGYDGGKKVAGRKRHIIVDTLGLLLEVMVTPADVQDREAAFALLLTLRERFRKISLVWADGGYTGDLIGWALRRLKLTVEVVKRTDDTTGFVVLPRRWVVERTLAWLMRSRRLVRDYETLPATHEAMVQWSMTTLMTRRLARGAA
jgi:transposase